MAANLTSRSKSQHGLNPDPPINAFYQQARFLSAAAKLNQAPPDTGHEVAFAGRSNAGKSSAINAICYQRQLARTSKTPGRTQQLVFFELDATRRIVDLPGYGYAKVSESVKHQWQRLMASYLAQRQSLAGLVVVMDIRRPLTEFDLQMLEWGRRIELKMLLLLTKSDKLKRGAIRATLDSVKKATAADHGRVRAEVFSAQTRQGLQQVQSVLDGWLGVGS